MAGHGTSIWAILAGVGLFIWGLLWTLFGAASLLFGNAANSFPGVPAGFDLGGALAVIGIVLLVIGILHLLSAIFIWAHRDWARYLGLVLAVLGTLLGVLSLVSALSPQAQDLQNRAGEGALTGALILLIPYGVALVGLIIGGAHFRRQYG